MLLASDGGLGHYHASQDLVKRLRFSRQLPQAGRTAVRALPSPMADESPDSWHSLKAILERAGFPGTARLPNGQGPHGPGDTGSGVQRAANPAAAPVQDMGVDHRGFRVPVAKDFLDRLDVVAAFTGDA